MTSQSQFEPENDLYQTKDWIESSILMAVGVPLLKATAKGTTYFFTFKNNLKAQQVLESYLRGDLTVNAQRFVESQRKVKDVVHRGL